MGIHWENVMHFKTINKMLEGLDRAKREVEHLRNPSGYVGSTMYPQELLDVLDGLESDIEKTKNAIRQMRTK
jgi:hypothetical protein